jgi:hypothetical protein
MIEPQSETADQRIDLVRVFLLQERRRVLVGYVDNQGFAIDPGEPCARDPVLETLRAQLLFELFFD